jgi:hypothetical protein
MAFDHRFKPTHKEIKRYYEDLAAYAAHEVSHEGATSSAFQNLLAASCKKADWHLVPQLATKIKGKTVRPDGTLRDSFNLHHGYWEAKDSSDKLDVEIRKKIALGYPLSNTIDITDPQQLCDLLNLFYSHVEPDIDTSDLLSMCFMKGLRTVLTFCLIAHFFTVKYGSFASPPHASDVVAHVAFAYRVVIRESNYRIKSHRSRDNA